MKKSEAANYLEGFRLALQRHRSIILEDMGDMEDALAAIFPWVFGDSCPLPALTKILDNYYNTNKLSIMDYYNMSIIYHRFMPEIGIGFFESGAIMPQINPAERWEDE